MKAQEAVEVLSALAQSSRLEAFRLLVRTGQEGLPAGEIAKDLGIPPATLSFHLSLLTRAGLIEARRLSRSIIYTLRTQGIQDLMEFLIGDCCQGRPELCAPAVACVSCCEPRSNSVRRRKGKVKT